MEKQRLIDEAASALRRFADFRDAAKSAETQLVLSLRKLEDYCVQNSDARQDERVRRLLEWLLLF